MPGNNAARDNAVRDRADRDDTIRDGALRRRAQRMARRRRHALAGDRGEVTVELVIATPLLLFALLGVVQFALWSHATHVAQAATARAVATARVLDGTPAAGHDAGQRMLDDLAAGPLHEPTLIVNRGASSVSARVDGEATSLLPGVALPVHADTTGAVERFLPDLTTPVAAAIETPRRSGRAAR